MQDVPISMQKVTIKLTQDQAQKIYDALASTNQAPEVKELLILLRRILTPGTIDILEDETE